MKRFCLSFLFPCLFFSGCAAKVSEPPSPLPESSVVIESGETVSPANGNKEAVEVKDTEKAQMMLLVETNIDMG